MPYSYVKYISFKPRTRCIGPTLYVYDPAVHFPDSLHASASIWSSSSTTNACHVFLHAHSSVCLSASHPGRPRSCCCHRHAVSAACAVFSSITLCLCRGLRRQVMSDAALRRTTPSIGCILVSDVWVLGVYTCGSGPSVCCMTLDG